MTLNVICVNKGNFLGQGTRYVRNLYWGVHRHLKNKPFKFHEVTDGLGEGWWAKIGLFKPGRFTGRCLYFDLDTIITGSLDDLASYEGDFAGLSDFYHPDRFASGVMAWDADKAGHIFTRWVNVGMPQFDTRGDQGWIGAMRPNAERLQDLFPGQLVSFKADCREGAPDGARVVCFHGLPRPHQLSDLFSEWR
jgi:hypothetical protein